MSLLSIVRHIHVVSYWPVLGQVISFEVNNVSLLHPLKVKLKQNNIWKHEIWDELSSECLHNYFNWAKSRSFTEEGKNKIWDFFNLFKMFTLLLYPTIKGILSMNYALGMFLVNNFWIQFRFRTCMVRCWKSPSLRVCNWSSSLISDTDCRHCLAWSLEMYPCFS